MTRGVYSRGKRPSERIKIEWDFAAELATVPGDVISAFPVTVKDTAGTDVTGPMLVSTALLGTVVQAWIQAGAAGTSYLVGFKVTAASGAIYENDVLLAVRNDA
jgi:hypothetical protein